MGVIGCTKIPIIVRLLFMYGHPGGVERLQTGHGIARCNHLTTQVWPICVYTDQSPHHLNTKRRLSEAETTKPPERVAFILSVHFDVHGDNSH